ncbi:MAG: cell wall hydrolase [Methanothrix sp.]|nr:cell wall hydrolase [Methanothrix sp.]
MKISMNNIGKKRHLAYILIMLSFIYLSLINVGVASSSRPDDFEIWSNDSIRWAEAHLQDPFYDYSKNVGLCMRFVACAYKQDANVLAGGNVDEIADKLKPLYGQEIDPKEYDKNPNQWDQVPTGALIFYSGKGSNSFGHVGIHLGKGKVIHAYEFVMVNKISELPSKSLIGKYIGWAYPPSFWVPTPNLISPEPGQKINTLTPTFEWNKVPNADHYKLCIGFEGSKKSNQMNFQTDGTRYDLPAGTLMENTKYSWNVTAISGNGDSSHAGKTRSFETLSSDISNSEALNVKNNEPKIDFKNLNQLKEDGEKIPLAGRIKDRTVLFKSKLSDRDDDGVKLEVELRRLDEYDGGFKDIKTDLKSSDYAETDGAVLIHVDGLINGKYHWRARAIDEHEVTSDWIEFGNNKITDADFEVVSAGTDKSSSQTESASKNTASPTSKAATTSPTSKAATTSPTSKAATTSPTSKAATTSPTSKAATTSPTLKATTTSPTSKAATATPTSKAATTTPTSKAATTSPTLKAITTTPTSETTTASVTGAAPPSNVASSSQESDAKCLATAIMSEASIGNNEERIAVAWTIINRVNSPKFPNTICAVVNQPSQYATNQVPTQEILDLANSLLLNTVSDITEGSVYFFSPIGMPKEGDDTNGYDVGGGLHDVAGINRRVFFPSWTLTNEYVGDIPGIRPAYFMFYRELVQTDTESISQSIKFENNDKVVTTDRLKVRQDPGLSSDVLITEDVGMTGTILSGPIFKDDYWWWQINFDDGNSGWSAENWLESVPSIEESTSSVISDQDVIYQGNRTINERVVTTDRLKVRLDAGLSSDIITTEDMGMTGTILSGPIFKDDYWWWQINFDDGNSGWSAENWLESAPPIEESTYQEPQYQEPDIQQPVYQGPRSINERVVTTDRLKVRYDAGLSSDVITTEDVGMTGMILSGPIFKDDYWWWQVNFDDGNSGWSAENWLESA